MSALSAALSGNGRWAERLGPRARLTGNPVRWDTSPSVSHFTDRLTSWGDSQLLFTALSGVPVDSLTRRALAAEDAGRLDDALRLWNEEWALRPWHRYAAYRMLDLGLRLDRLDEVDRRLEDLVARWPRSSYVQHLALRLPDVRRFLESPAPRGARAELQPDAARRAIDSRLGTAWSTGRPQRAGDRLDLDVDPGVAVRGVVVISVPDFGAGPSGLEVEGTSALGKDLHLATLRALEASQKGWVALRFEPVRLRSLRLTVRGRSEEPWVVSEARVLLASR